MGIFLLGIFPGRSFPRWYYSGRQFSRREFSGWEFSGRDISGFLPKPLTTRDRYDVVAEFAEALFASYCACPAGRVVVLFITRMTVVITPVVFVTGL